MHSISATNVCTSVLLVVHRRDHVLHTCLIDAHALLSACTRPGTPFEAGSHDNYSPYSRFLDLASVPRISKSPVTASGVALRMSPDAIILLRTALQPIVVFRISAHPCSNQPPDPAQINCRAGNRQLAIGARPADLVFVLAALGGYGAADAACMP